MKLILSVFALTALVACSDKSERAENGNATTYSDTTTTTSSSSARDADNTAKNERDRDSNAMTADGQMEGSKGDVEITRQIRAAIVEDDSLSSNAKNVKIITKSGQVNLRGPVANAAESTKIASIAQKYVGAAKVKNELEVSKD
jgi:osmotically-inducible protein OsmY